MPKKERVSLEQLVDIIEGAAKNDIYFDIEKIGNKQFLIPPEVLASVFRYETGDLLKAHISNMQRATNAPATFAANTITQSF